MRSLSISLLPLYAWTISINSALCSRAGVSPPSGTFHFEWIKFKECKAEVNTFLGFKMEWQSGVALYLIADNDDSTGTRAAVEEIVHRGRSRWSLGDPWAYKVERLELKPDWRHGGPFGANKELSKELMTHLLNGLNAEENREGGPLITDIDLRADSMGKRGVQLERKSQLRSPDVTLQGGVGLPNSAELIK